MAYDSCVMKDMEGKRKYPLGLGKLVQLRKERKERKRKGRKEKKEKGKEGEKEEGSRQVLSQFTGVPTVRISRTKE